MILSVGSADLKLETTAFKGLNYQGGNSEYSLQQSSWRREWDSN